MKKNDFMSSFWSLFRLSSIDFWNTFTGIYDLFDRYVKGRYKQYKEEKRQKKLSEYKKYITSCISFYQEELSTLDVFISAPSSETQFSEFYISARNRCRKQYQKELLHQSLCFDDDSFDTKILHIHSIVQLRRDYDCLADEIRELKDNSSSPSQTFLTHYLASVDQIRAILPSALNLALIDIVKAEALEYEDIAVNQKHFLNFEINQFYTTIAQFVFYARKDRDLTQQDLSDLSGINRSTIAKIEALNQLPTYETLIQLLSFFDAKLMICLNSPPKVRLE